MPLKFLNMMKRILFFIFLVFTMFSCDPLLNSLTDEEIVEGLKSALEEGSKYALKTLGKEDGFLLDQAVKIGLPEDAAKFIQQALAHNNPFIQGLVSGLEEKLIKTMNRAAELAVNDVVPIFVDAITGITFQDASNILFSSDNYAATHYLQDKTYAPLTNTCLSVIEDALNQKILGIGSAQDIWDLLTTTHNKIATLVPATNWVPIETDLSLYTTHKALDGVFLKVGDEEQNIRINENARVNDILKKVFGQLD
jgi:hypothetical protein